MILCGMTRASSWNVGKFLLNSLVVRKESSFYFMYLFPVLLLGRGPMMFMVILLSDSSIIGNWMRGAWPETWGCHLTFWTWSAVVSHMPVERWPVESSHTLLTGFFFPMCPAIGILWARSNTGFLHCLGKIRSISSRSPLLAGGVQRQYNKPSRF